jgi:Domain of unknown function (DUF222)
MFECACQSIDWVDAPPQRLTKKELAGAEFLEPGHPLAVDTTADVLVEEAGCIAFGPHTLSRLLAVPFSELSESGRSSALQTLTRFSDYVDGLAAELTGLIAGPTPTTDETRRDDFSAHEVSVATRCSVYAADAKISFARDLTERLQATAVAMADGQISERQARHLSEETSHLDIEIAQELEAKVLKFSHRQDFTAFKLSVRRWLSKLDPNFVARATAARKDCVVEHTAGDDGTGSLFIRGPLEITTEISMALTAYAAKTKPELGGTAAQRKLAGLRDMAEQYLGSPDCPKHHGRLPVLNITTDLPTVLGMRDNPAEIPGVGAIPADVVRWLLADGAPLRRLIIDPENGQLLDYGRKTYVVPPALADLLIAKHVTSAGPHSRIDATGCDIDHNKAWDNGGATNPINNTPVDRRWHRAKTHANWTYTKNPDTGVITWRSPTGLTCEIHPYDYRAGP